MFVDEIILNLAITYKISKYHIYKLIFATNSRDGIYTSTLAMVCFRAIDHFYNAAVVLFRKDIRDVFQSQNIM